MKLIVNKCFGGWGISPPCLWELINTKAKCVDVCTLPEYFGRGSKFHADKWESRKNEAIRESVEWWTQKKDRDFADFAATLPSGFVLHHLLYGIYDLNNDIFYGVNKEEARQDPTLIALIEKNGVEWANGRFASLRIIEIPDGVQFEIEDYDGVESVHETHRVFG